MQEEELRRMGKRKLHDMLEESEGLLSSKKPSFMNDIKEPTVEMLHETNTLRVYKGKDEEDNIESEEEEDISDDEVSDQDEGNDNLNMVSVKEESHNGKEDLPFGKLFYATLYLTFSPVDTGFSHIGVYLAPSPCPQAPYPSLFFYVPPFALTKKVGWIG